MSVPQDLLQLLNALDTAHADTLRQQEVVRVDNEAVAVAQAELAESQGDLRAVRQAEETARQAFLGALAAAYPDVAVDGVRTSGRQSTGRRA